MNISIEKVKSLREKCGAGILECRKALEEAKGDEKKALAILKKKGLELAAKKSQREVKQGVIECYSHGNGRVVSVVELLTETDFVARNKEFRELAHELAMQIAAMKPKDTKELLDQEYIRDPSKKIDDLVKEAVSKIRENIKIGRIARFELGE